MIPTLQGEGTPLNLKFTIKCPLYHECMSGMRLHEFPSCVHNALLILVVEQIRSADASPMYSNLLHLAFSCAKGDQVRPWVSSAAG